jgi:hypothetical protein
VSGEPEKDIDASTVEAMREHDAAVEVWRFRWAEERDRRYKEVNEEREKALKIKDTADRDALSLDRQIRDYKDEKANELREQINRERLLYATKDDVKSVGEKMEAAIKPLSEYVTGQQGRSGGLNQGWVWILGGIAALGTLFSIGAVVVGLIVFLSKGVA